MTGLLLENVDRHLAGTLEWVHTTPEFSSWLAGDEAKVLWFTGLPGVGKSVIAAHIIKTLYSSLSERTKHEIPQGNSLSSGPMEVRAESYLTYFFCKSGEQKLMYAHNIIRTVSYQLARQNEIFLRELGEIRFAEQFTVRSSVGIRLLYNRLLEQPLAAVAKTAIDGLEILCVIDGLDEADFTARDGVSEIQILLQLLSKADGIRLLVVSRTIRELFETLDNSVIKEISSADNSGDIERYVQWKTSTSEKLERGFRHLQIDPASRLHDSAGGNFLWIDTVLHYLETSPSLIDFKLSLREIPAQFFALYRQILRRITETVPPRTRAVIKEIIRVTITSPRELEVVELQALVEEFTKDRFFDFTHLIKSVCGTFLRVVDDAVNPKLKYVRVVHETFRDFITSPINNEEDFHVSLPQAHGEMAEALLHHLLEQDFGSQLIPGENVELNERIVAEIQQRFPLLRYTVTQWSYHLSRASVEHLWVKKLRLTLESFLHQGPLLLWIEALAIYEIKALSRVRAEVTLWNSRTLPLFDGSEFAALLDSWARDITRLSQEYSTVLARRPNSVYCILFDLFPCPSLLRERYEKDVVLVSGGVSDPLHPAIVGVSSIYDHDYDLAAFWDGPEKLLALSSLRHIRVGHQMFGESIGLIRPLDSDRWAVLAMSFSSSRGGQTNMLAVVHVPLFDNDTPYHPEVSIWDVDTLTLVAKRALNRSYHKTTTCLVDWVEFADNTGSVRCGCWKYRIEGRNLVEDNGHSFTMNADWAVLSRNGEYALLLNPGEDRTLVGSGGRIMTFAKAPFYHYETDDPARAPPDDIGFQRWLVAPVHWWQLWREVTRAYQFSADSRWFARFTEEHCVTLCDLETFTERIVHRPEGSWSCILMNNLTFDAASERLIWTFHYNNSSDTRVHIWNKGSTSSGFYLGRCGWMERVNFCSDTNYVLTYRAAVTVWDVPLAFRVDETSQVQSKSEDWVVVLENWYNSDYSIQLGYSHQKMLYSLIREEVSEGLFTFQAFDRETGTSRRISFQSQSLLQTTRWGPQWTTNGEIFVTENALVDVSDITNLTVSKHVDILRPREVLASTCHISGSLMACLQLECDRLHWVSLQVYNIDDNRLLKSTTFGYDDPHSQRRPSNVRKPWDAILLFDPENPPTYLFVMLAPTDDLEARPRDLYSSNLAEGAIPWKVWFFQLPSLEHETTFDIAASGAIRTPYTRFTGLVAGGLGKVVCFQESKHSVACALWLIDLDNHTWSLQCLPECWLLAFVSSSGMIVALTAEGWVECKRISEMDSNILKYGNGKHKFDSINDQWIWSGWKKLLYLPASYLPCYESSMAIHEEGELAYVDEYGKRLVQISFKW